MGNRADLPDAVAAKIEPEPMSGCWLWTGGAHPNGYGGFTIDSTPQYVHRFVYEQLVGPIPDGLELDHLCRNRACVSPWHLEAVTHLENVRRGRAGVRCKTKTHCPQGHPYDEANTYHYRGSRICRACRKPGGRL